MRKIQLWRVDVQKKKKMNDIEQYDLVYKKSKKIMFLGIPIVWILLTFPMNGGYYEFFTLEHYISMFFSIIVSGIFWISCMSIVIKLWKKYP